jgi:malic enzyme
MDATSSRDKATTRKSLRRAGDFRGHSSALAHAHSYVFPGIGLAAVAVGSKHLNDDDMYVAAKALAALVPQDRIDVRPNPDASPSSLRFTPAVA